MPPQADTAVFDERFLRETIARLYLVVQGRPPDPSGLAFHMGHLRSGMSLQAIAEEFIASVEFRFRVGSQDPRTLFYHRALGPDAEPSAQMLGQSLGQIAAALVLSPEVQKRLPVLPALYPDGVPLKPEDYRIWLLGRPSPPPDPRPGCPGKEPAVSFVILLDRPNPAWLTETVRSVLRVRVPLQLVFATRWSMSLRIRKAIGRDKRVQLVQVPPWFDQVAMFNWALVRCSGQFTGLIGQHDQVDETTAPLPAVRERGEIIITDDDRLGEDGLRQDPRLGTEWDPDRTIATGCPGLILIRTVLLRRIGGMQHCQGREEWDMLLRAAATVDQARIIHMPLVALTRTAPSPEPLQPAHVAAAEHYLRASGQQGSVHSENGVLRVVYPLPASPPMVSIIIPTRDRSDLLGRCIEGLLTRTDYPGAGGGGRRQRQHGARCHRSVAGTRA